MGFTGAPKAAEAGPASLQLVSGAGEFNLRGLCEFAKTVGLYERGLDYAIVAIMGPQSSGKSTLLNALFGTKFEMMDCLKGRRRTTQGIWMAVPSVTLAKFTLVLDLEGTDGRERGEDGTAFEKQSTLFALATADVIIVNMWCHDIGREQAANKPLLKTVFQVMMRMFMPRKATLLFVIRDKTKTPIALLAPILWEEMEEIWASLPKPEKHRDSAISDFFNVEVTWLPSFEMEEEEFKKKVGSMRSRFLQPDCCNRLDWWMEEQWSAEQPIAPGAIAVDRAGGVPAQALPLSLQCIWERIRRNKDLDLPAHRVMVATVRCEEIAEEKLRALTGSKEWEAMKDAVNSPSADLASFGATVNELVSTCLASYEGEAAYFEESVRASKKDQLVQRLRDAVGPAHAAAVTRLSNAALQGFKAALDAFPVPGGEDDSAPAFAQASRDCRTRAAAGFEAATGGMSVLLIGLEVERAREKLLAEMEAHASTLRSYMLKVVQKNAVEVLLGGLMGDVVAILKAGNGDAWQRIGALWRAKMGACREVVLAKIKGFEMEPAEDERVVGRVEEQGRKAIEDKTRELSKSVKTLMKKRFRDMFLYDAQGLPRPWKKCLDVIRLNNDARRASLGVMAAVAAVQLDPQPGNETASNPILARLMPLLDNPSEACVLAAPAPSAATPGAATSSLCLWDNVPALATFLSPDDCRAVWEQFTEETLHLLESALQAQRAGSLCSCHPWWSGAR